MAFVDLFYKSDEAQSQSNQKKESGGMVVGTPHTGSTVVSRTESDNSVNDSQSGSFHGGSTKSISADDKIVNMIWDKIIESNRPGPDYLELKNNVEALEDLPISKEQKLMSAFKVLKKGYPNFQKGDITKAIDFYINVVESERESGLKELEEMRIRNVDGTENEIKTMQMKAEELKRQYDELQAKIGEKTIELTKSKNEIEMNYNTFIGSVNAVMNVLNSDKENILSINF